MKKNERKIAHLQFRSRFYLSRQIAETQQINGFANFLKSLIVAAFHASDENEI